MKVYSAYDSELLMVTHMRFWSSALRRQWRLALLGIGRKMCMILRSRGFFNKCPLSVEARHSRIYICATVDKSPSCQIVLESFNLCTQPIE